MTTVIATEKQTRSYNRSSKAASKMTARKVMNRAWYIARNAHKAYMSNHMSILFSNKMARNVSEFFTESLKLAWEEQNTGKEIYVAATLPKKNLSNLISAYNDSLKEGLSKVETAKAIASVRFASIPAKVQACLDEIDSLISNSAEAF